MTEYDPNLNVPQRTPATAAFIASLAHPVDKPKPRRRKKPTEPAPVTVAELLLALASYPQDAVVTLSDPFTALGVTIGEEYQVLWENGSTPPTHYGRPDVVVQEVERSHPGDEYAIASEFLAWLRGQSIGLTNAGQGHNETASPMMEVQRARLAEEFAERPLA